MIEWDQPEWVEVLAAAQAEAGQFDLAIQWQQKAIEKLTITDNAATYSRMQTYQARQAFRQTCVPHNMAELIPGGRAVRPQSPRPAAALSP